MAAHLKRAYFLLHILAVEAGLWLARLFIQSESNMNIGHFTLKGAGIDSTVVGNKTVAQGVESNAAVHGASVDINVAQATGQLLGHRALAT